RRGRRRASSPDEPAATRASREPSGVPARRPPRSGGGARRGGVGMKLLVIEDDVALGVALRDGLTSAGFAVDVAATLGAAARKRRVNLYDLIVLDLGMPDGDGLEFLARLRDSAASIPVMVLTARGSVPSRVGGLNAGADDYLAKPFAFPELIARIRALLRR